ncbi:hypothetical protein SAMN04487969_1246 [Paenibacillus algorifonticola]|uniref:DUF5666 domain-containing protein n=1 Tax=Paenibacillus algorifonticola TaxID=684063 RepID=A0A1I2HNI8_9BACL|nr:hypothetical protein [Paenibacillus algorifonticola]SFF29941.1 hypothetical protein SAMN04487969_1246 [Paenibacillus algorifonticola]
MKNWKTLLSTILITATLAACSANQTATTTTAAAGTEAAAAQSETQADAGAGQAQGDPGQGGMMMGGTMGKIKSIDGQTITLYKSSFTPGDRQGGGQPPAQGDAQQGEAGTAPDGTQPEPPAQDDGQAAQGQGGGRMNMENMFTEETVEVTVTDATTITAISFENDQRVETTKTLADLKADDIVTYTVTDGTQDAATIQIGGMMGGGMSGGRPGSQGAGGGAASQGSDAAAEASPEASRAATS